MVRASPGSDFCSRKHIFDCGEGENEAAGSLAWAQNTTHCCSTRWWRWGAEEEGHIHQPAGPGWAACRTAKGRLSLKESWVSRHQHHGSTSLFSRLIWNTNLRFFWRRTGTLARTWLAVASGSYEELWVFVRPCLRTWKSRVGSDASLMFSRLRTDNSPPNSLVTGPKLSSLPLMSVAQLYRPLSWSALKPFKVMMFFLIFSLLNTEEGLFSVSFFTPLLKDPMNSIADLSSTRNQMVRLPAESVWQWMSTWAPSSTRICFWASPDVISERND